MFRRMNKPWSRAGDSIHILTYWIKFRMQLTTWAASKASDSYGNALDAKGGNSIRGFYLVWHKAAMRMQLRKAAQNRLTGAASS